MSCIVARIDHSSLKSLQSILTGLYCMKAFLWRAGDWWGILPRDRLRELDLPTILITNLYFIRNKQKRPFLCLRRKLSQNQGISMHLPWSYLHVETPFLKVWSSTASKSTMPMTILLDVPMIIPSLMLLSLMLIFLTVKSHLSWHMLFLEACMPNATWTAMNI